MTQTPPQRAQPGAAPGAAMAARLSPFWSRHKVEAELGLDAPDLDAAVADGHVLGLETSDGVVVFPVAQFERVNDRTRVRPGVRTMLEELKGDDRWSVALIFTAPAEELSDLSPYEAVIAGTDSARLAAFAHYVHAQWR